MTGRIRMHASSIEKERTAYHAILAHRLGRFT